jgi:hypothetical protein
MSVAVAISATLAAQGQRVVAFKSWDSALADYLKDGDVAVYRQQVSHACTRFQACHPLILRFSARRTLRCSKHAAKRSTDAHRNCRVLPVLNCIRHPDHSRREENNTLLRDCHRFFGASVAGFGAAKARPHGTAASSTGAPPPPAHSAHVPIFQGGSSPFILGVTFFVSLSFSRVFRAGAGHAANCGRRRGLRCCSPRAFALR